MFKSIFPRKYDNVASRMKYVYKKKLLPLEKLSLFNHFHSPEMHDKLFDAKPMIMIFGQYSTGKTTFIKTLLGMDYPGILVGPEPTTDRFMVIMDKEENGKDIIPGNALVMDAKFPFRGLTKFGRSFLDRFQGSFAHSPFLQNMTILDTPGVLSGEKQGLKRGYDFPEVLRWFADNSDKIILVFDAHKLDVPDELRRCMDILNENQEKVRILLNKADMVDHHNLIKVYGSLMWALGKIIPNPEVSKVYIGSFWNQPLKQEIYKGLFENEKMKLYEDLQSIPKHGCLRKINDLIKRAHMVKAHAYVMSSIYKNRPRFFRQVKRKKRLIDRLPAIYQEIQSAYYLKAEDMPNIGKMQRFLMDLDFSKLNHINSNKFKNVDEILTEDITKLMTLVDAEGEQELASEILNGDEEYSTETLESPDLIKSPKPQL